MLSPKQHRLYLYEWGQLQANWRAAGLKATDETRKQLQAQAIGREITSKALTNKELDRVIYYFRAASAPSAIPAYRQIADTSITPTYRARYAARHLTRRLKPDITTDHAADAYILATARNMHKDPTLQTPQIDLATYRNICSAFTYRLRAQEAKLAKTTGIGWPKADAAPVPVDEENPF